VSGARHVRREASGQRLTLDPIACEAHGLCMGLLPERITADDWGYPLIDGRPLAPELVAHARRAAAACPTLALKLARTDAQPRPGSTRSAAP
jgi:ferredoxin